MFLFDKMKREKTELMLKYFLKEIQLPFVDLESNRQLLLLGRNEKSSLRNLKIPLLEKDIDKHADIYRDILEEIKKDNRLKVEENSDSIKVEIV